MSEYLLQHGTRSTPQTEPMSPDQVANSAGGFVWAVDKWTRLRRFLILGSEGGSYYASERKLTQQNVSCVKECIDEDGLRTVNTIVEISKGGNAPKNDPALFALAAAISLGDRDTRVAAGKALPDVARIGTHLYHFVAYAETMRGWGKVMRKAVQGWYDRNPDQLALQAIKYRQRDGWTHSDLLRLSHPKVEGDLDLLYRWIVGKHESENDNDLSSLVHAFEAAQRSSSPSETASLVRTYNLPREALLTEHLNDKDVWFALLEQKMPMTALTRNLATMTRIGVLDSKEHMGLVLGALGDAEIIRKSRLHPMALLIALRTYASGRGFRGTNTWRPLAPVIDALDAAFYTAFDNVESTGKSHLLCLDVSPSMGSGQVAGAPITPREAAAAMALVTLHAESDCEVVGFAGKLEPLGFSRRQRLDDVTQKVGRIGWSHTDCALPFIHAHAEKLKIDAFFVYTDSETFFNRHIHPKQALDQYRQHSGINSKSVVAAFVSNGFTIADPQDAGMMDVVGFDTAAPGVMADFVAGRL